MPPLGDIKLRAVSSKPGTYEWRSRSSKLFLKNETQETVDVHAADFVSLARGAELIELVFTPDGESACAPVTLGISIVRCKFVEARDQKYGFDDMVANALFEDPRLCVKVSDATTVMLHIDGGGLPSDFTIESFQPGTATAAFRDAESGKVDVKGVAEGSAHVRVLCKCDAGQSLDQVFAELDVDVFHEPVFTINVMRCADSTSRGTALTTPALDVPGCKGIVDSIYRTAVVTSNVVDTSGGAVRDVRFDPHKAGVFLHEQPDGGPGFRALQTAMGARKTGEVNCAIVNRIWWFFPLGQAARGGTGQRVVRLASNLAGVAAFVVPTTWTLSSRGGVLTGPTYDVVSRSGLDVTLDREIDEDHDLTHGLAQEVGGLGGDIITMVDSTNLRKLAKIMAHEGMHALGGLFDLVEKETIMPEIGPAGNKLVFHDQHFFFPDEDHHGLMVQRQWVDVRRR